MARGRSKETPAALPEKKRERCKPDESEETKRYQEGKAPDPHEAGMFDLDVIVFVSFLYSPHLPWVPHTKPFFFAPM